MYYLPHTALWNIDSALNKIVSLPLKSSHFIRREITVINVILSHKCLKCALWAMRRGLLATWRDVHLLESCRSDLRSDGSLGD